MVWKRCDCSLIHTMRWIKKIIIFDIFFQENKIQKSSSIFSYILFIYLFFMVYLLTFPNNIGINIQTLLFVLSIEISYVLSFFNWYYCLNKSIFLFIIIYLLPICGIGILYLLLPSLPRHM